MAQRRPTPPKIWQQLEHYQLLKELWDGLISAYDLKSLKQSLRPTLESAVMLKYKEYQGTLGAGELSSLVMLLKMLGSQIEKVDVKAEDARARLDSLQDHFGPKPGDMPFKVKR